MHLQEGILFDSRYRLIKQLGRGGFSEVWLVEDTMVNHKKMALKVYAPGSGLDDDGVQLFRKEFDLVFDFNHTNLLCPAHFSVCEHSPYLLMPYCERGSAAKLIGKITEEEAWRSLHDIAAGLTFLHEQEPHVIHQDIKPDNILIDKTGRFLITDFGISAKARRTLRQSMGNAKSGTIAYMSPERFGRNNAPIKASDIWSLGATLFELLTGDAPFGEHGGVIQKSGADIPDLSGGWSPELKKIVTLCLQREAWDRPTAKLLVEWTEEHFKGNDPFKLKEKKAKGGKDKVADTKPWPSESKDVARNGFVSFWLWATAIVNGFFAVVLLLTVLLEFEFELVLYSNIFILNTCAAAWLLRRVKLGFWLFIVSVFLVAATTTNFGYNEEIFMFLFAIVFVIILFAVLQIRKNGVSAWNALRKPDGKKDRVTFIVFGSILFASLVVIPLVGYILYQLFGSLL